MAAKNAELDPAPISTQHVSFLQICQHTKSTADDKRLDKINKLHTYIERVVAGRICERVDVKF